MDLEQMEKAREEEKEIGTRLREADIKNQVEEQHERIANSRYNQRYKELYTITKPKYLTAQYKGRDQKIIARFKCGNEERKNKYWKNEQDKRCRLCMDNEKSLEHLALNWKYGENSKNNTRRPKGAGAEWMRRVIKRRKEIEQETKE